MKQTTMKICFAQKEQAENWMKCNCDKCVKAQRMSKGKQTKCRCVFQADILKQIEENGVEIRETTYELTKHAWCPKRKLLT